MTHNCAPRIGTIGADPYNDRIVYAACVDCGVSLVRFDLQDGTGEWSEWQLA